jgi:hypothetical protein
MTTTDKQFEWLRGSHEKLQESVSLLREDVAALKVKAGVWGLIAGAIPAAVLIILLLIKGAL